MIQARFGADFDGSVEVGIGFERFGGVFEIVFDAVFLHKRYVLVDRQLGFLSKKNGRTQQRAQEEKVTLHKMGVLVLNQTEWPALSNWRIAFTFIVRSMRALGLFGREKNGGGVSLALQTPGYGVRVMQSLAGRERLREWDSFPPLLVFFHLRLKVVGHKTNSSKKGLCPTAHGEGFALGWVSER